MFVKCVLCIKILHMCLYCTSVVHILFEVRKEIIEMSMRRKLAFIALLVMLIAPAGLASAVVTVPAESVSRAWIGLDANDNSGQGVLGQTYYVFWEGVTPEGAYVDVTLYDPNGNPIYTFNGQLLTDSGDAKFAFQPTIQGRYVVVLSGAQSPIPTYGTLVASGSLFVVPEAIFGTLTALGAGLAVFGIFRKVKQKRV